MVGRSTWETRMRRPKIWGRRLFSSNSWQEKKLMPWPMKKFLPSVSYTMRTDRQPQDCPKQNWRSWRTNREACCRRWWVSRGGSKRRWTMRLRKRRKSSFGRSGWWRDYGQGFLCQLCGKETWGGPGCPHLRSSTHQEKEREEILLDRMFRTPEARRSRRFGDGCHEPTKAAMRKYWGPNMENLIMEMKMRCGEEIRFKYGKSQKAASYVISKARPYRFHLALIKYSETTGVYKNGSFLLDDVRLWNSLPEIEDEDMERTYQKNQKKGDKWWPVIMCQQVGEDDPQAFQEVLTDFIYVVICLYQVLQKPLTAWCVNFVARDSNTNTSSIKGPRGALGQEDQIHQDHQDLQDHHMKGPGQAARPRIDVLPKYWCLSSIP